MAMGLVSVMLVTRYLPPEEYGAFVLLQVVVVFLAEITSLGLTVSVPKFIACTESKRDKRTLVNTVICFRILTALAVSLLVLIARRLLILLYDSPLLLSLIIYLPVLLTLESLGKLLKSIFEGFFLFNRIGIVDFAAGSLNLLFIVLFVVFLDQGLSGLVYAKLISMAVSYTFAYFSNPIERKLEFDYTVLKDVLAFGLPLQLQYILGFLFLRVDTLMLGALLGPAGIAYYEVARKIPESLVRLYDAFRAVYFPSIANLFARGKHHQATKMLNHSTRWLSFLTISGALIALLLGNDIISLLFSESYLPSVPAFVLLMIELNLTLVETTLGYSLVAIGAPDKPLIANAARTGTNLLGNLLIIPASGFVGAALAKVASNLVAIPLDVLFLRRRRIYVRPEGYLKPLLIFGAFGLGFVLLGSSSLLLRIAIIVFFFLACLLLSVITRDDLAFISEVGKMILSRVLRKPRLKASVDRSS